ncbi:MAG: hypothetical protein GXY83_20615 [Rhodopirellula sp.]|nr:hypothetical protein [Rhodopirellula sp.]
MASEKDSDHPMRERFQFSIGEAALVIALCAVLLAATQTVGSKQVILQWAFSWGAVLLMAERLVYVTRRAQIMPGHAVIRKEQLAPSSVVRMCSECGAEAEPGFKACWSCGTWFDSETNSASEAATIPAARVIEAPCDRPTADSEDDDPMVQRAWRAALAGLFLWPLLPNIYSAWLLMRIRASKRVLSQSDQRCFRRAAVLDVAVCAVIGLFLGFLAIGWVVGMIGRAM